MMTENSASLMVSGSRPPRTRLVLVMLLLCGFLIVAALWYANTPRPSFPAGERVSIPEGSSLTYIAALLDEHKVVRSALLFRTMVSLLGGEAKIHAGVHVFQDPLSTYGVARALLGQETSVPPVRVTIPEGSTLAEFDTIITTALPHIAPGTIAGMVGEEAVLFPDTYFFRESSTAEEVIEALREHQEAKITPLRERIAAQELTEEEVLILASILEREANDETSMRLVSGILQDRLTIGMPLQVDAPFYYLLGKESAELTPEDLALDSPFNTYLYPGLPPEPINSPGIMAIEAVLDPTPSPYLYYLTDHEGNFYYAQTFDEHKENKAKYLE